MQLHEKILDCQEPVVGLDFITELLPESDPEVLYVLSAMKNVKTQIEVSSINVQMEPQYTCRLCGKTGPANGMFTHLMGGTHRYISCFCLMLDTVEKSFL